MKALVIARYCCLEAIRTRYPWLLVGILFTCVLVSVFFRAIAITESDRIQLSLFATFSRIALVLLMALHVASTMARQFTDKETDFVLALDLTRLQYLAGRYLGYCAVAAATALSAGLVLLAYGPQANALAWSASIALELMLIAAMTMFFVVSIVQIASALIFVIAFYLLARSIAALQLLSHSPVFSNTDIWTVLGQKAVDGIALILPRLDLFSQSSWLIEGSRAPELTTIFLQACAYIGMLFAASVFDLQRKEL